MTHDTEKNKELSPASCLTSVSEHNVCVWCTGMFFSSVRKMYSWQKKGRFVVKESKSPFWQLLANVQNLANLPHS